MQEKKLNKSIKKASQETKKAALKILENMQKILGEQMELITESFYCTKTKNVMLPLPVCKGHNNKDSGFHCIFFTLKEKSCQLQSLHLDHCLLGLQAEHLCCIGDVMLENTTLKELKIDDILPRKNEANIQYTLPLFISLHKNQTLTKLDVGSIKHALVESNAFKIMCESLANNYTLKTLNCSGWEFDLSIDESLINSFKKFLENTRLENLELTESIFSLKINKETSLETLYLKKRTTQLLNQSIKVLNLAATIFEVNDTIFQNRDIVPMLNFSALISLNISDYLSLVEDHDKAGFVDDESLLNCFFHIKKNLPNLELLKMVNWKILLKCSNKTLQRLKNILKDLKNLKIISLNNAQFGTLNINDIDETNRVANTTNDETERYSQLIKYLIKYLPSLQTLSLMHAKLDIDVPIVIKAVKTKVKRSNIQLHTKHAAFNEELLDKLEESDMNFKYDRFKGVIDFAKLDKVHSNNLFDLIQNVFLKI